MQAPYVLLRCRCFQINSRRSTYFNLDLALQLLPACLLCCALSGVRRMGVWVVEAAGCPVRWWPAHF